MRTGADFWIVRPFNAVFNLLLMFFVLLLVLASLLLRRKQEKTKQIVLISVCAVTLIGYFLYKYALSLDKDYDVITFGDLIHDDAGAAFLRECVRELGLES